MGIWSIWKSYPSPIIIIITIIIIIIIFWHMIHDMILQDFARKFFAMTSLIRHDQKYLDMICCRPWSV